MMTAKIVSVMVILLPFVPISDGLVPALVDPGAVLCWLGAAYHLVPQGRGRDKRFSHTAAAWQWVHSSASSPMQELSSASASDAM
jgi:hypothetical protein